MSALEVCTLLVVVAAFVGWHLSYTAARLHRLHTRVEGTLAALDAQLVRRAEAAVEASLSGVLDPAASLLLADAAKVCLEVSSEGLGARDWEERPLAEREEPEGELSELIRAIVTDFDAACGVAPPFARAVAKGERQVDVVARLCDAHARAALAKAFYNDAVTDVQWLRSRPLVRWCRLAGHARLPRQATFDAEPVRRA